MPNCPRCGSIAQVKEIKTSYIEDGWEITVYRDYECGCSCRFRGISVYVCQDQYEDIEED